MPETPTATNVQSVIDDLDQQLRQQRVSASSRRELLAEVRADLEEAAAAGQDPRSVVGDLSTFIQDVMDAKGLAPAPREPWLSPGVALLGGLGTLVAAYAVIELVLHPLLTSVIDLPGRYPIAGPVLVFGLLAGATVAGMIGAFALAVRGRAAAAESVRRSWVTIPLGAVVGGVAAFAYAQHTGFDTTNPTINTEIALIAIPCFVGIVAGRVWGVLTARRAAQRRGVTVGG